MNLLDNANRATAGIPVPKILFEARAGGGMAEFEISDNGPGFGARETDGKSGWGSTGIGLAFVREVAEAHGGKVAFRDVEGGGAQVCLSLPFGEKAENVEDEA
jgi:signal transduction histidine kinase